MYMAIEIERDRRIRVQYLLNAVTELCGQSSNLRKMSQSRHSIEMSRMAVTTTNQRADSSAAVMRNIVALMAEHDTFRRCARLCGVHLLR